MEQVKKSMKQGVTRRTTVLLALLVLLVISSYANYRMSAGSAAVQTELPVIRLFGPAATAQPTPQPTSTAPENSFASYREQRGTARAQEILMLDEMIADTTASTDSAEQARAQKLAIVRSMERETTLEGLLKAKGFEDVLVSAQDGSVSVVVKRESLTTAEATQILQLSMRETGEKARNIKIIPTK